MNVLLSIKPEFADKILAGTKRYEFRRSVPSSWETPIRVFIYASHPRKRIVGYFTAAEILRESPALLWEKCHNSAGIEKERFFTYFQGKASGNALVIEDVTPLPHPADPRELIKSEFVGPQSFCYIDSNFAEKLLNPLQS